MKQLRKCVLTISPLGGIWLLSKSSAAIREHQKFVAFSMEDHVRGKSYFNVHLVLQKTISYLETPGIAILVRRQLNYSLKLWQMEHKTVGMKVSKSIWKVSFDYFFSVPMTCLKIFFLDNLCESALLGLDKEECKAFVDKYSANLLRTWLALGGEDGARVCHDYFDCKMIWIKDDQWI